jgi:hypothetical protein
MSSGEESNRIENAARSGYDGRTELRFSAAETRIAAVEVDVAVIRTSYATKEDMQRIISILHEHKLEFTNGFARQRDDFNAAMAKQRDDFNAAMAKQREDFSAALALQQAAFCGALAQQSLDLHKTLMGHIWKFYGFASVLVAAVYYVARYVH